MKMNDLIAKRRGIEQQSANHEQWPANKKKEQGWQSAINQNGSVEVRAGCQPITARTSFSLLRVYVPEGEAYDVEARTSFGKVISEHAISVSGEVGGSSLVGKMGSGGCVLRLTNSNGNVEILKGVARTTATPAPAKKK